jgi:formylglycine-generating enzyme required for sulfatase activity
MKCPYCGSTHPPNTKYCPVTGKRISDEYRKEKIDQSVSRDLPQEKKIPKNYLIIGFIIFSAILIILGIILIISGLSKKDGDSEKQSVILIDETLTPSSTVYTKNETVDLLPPTNTAYVITDNQTQGEIGAVELTTIEPTITSEITEINETETNIINNSVNQKDSMVLVYVPEGEFLMGSDFEDDPYFFGAEGPMHTVSVNAFWIYQTEVTNAMYQACVEDHACPKPIRNNSRTISDYYTDPNYANYPVIQVNWVDAVSYCVWAGGRLPTEAEWEKAARGTDGRLFPWGNGGLEPQLASFCGTSCPDDYRENIDDGFPEIAPVGSFPDGASPYGALDMAGNVWEWVRDFFEPLYYETSPYDNPLGPATGDRRALRGGSWRNPAGGIRTVVRISLPQTDGLDTVGFRCVVDIDG